MYIFPAIIYLSFQLYTIKNNAGLTIPAFDYLTRLLIVSFK